MTKKLLLTLVFTALFLSANQTQAKTYKYTWTYDNGCVGIRTYHSVLWWKWYTDEIIDCPTQDIQENLN